MDRKERFINFIVELAKLTLVYGVVIKSVGGVAIFDEGELEEIEYSKDSTSGDLIPYFKTRKI